MYLASDTVRERARIRVHRKKMCIDCNGYSLRRCRSLSSSMYFYVPRLRCLQRHHVILLRKKNYRKSYVVMVWFYYSPNATPSHPLLCHQGWFNTNGFFHISVSVSMCVCCAFSSFLGQFLETLAFFGTHIGMLTNQRCCDDDAEKKIWTKKTNTKVYYSNTYIHTRTHPANKIRFAFWIR